MGLAQHWMDGMALLSRMHIGFHISGLASECVACVTQPPTSTLRLICCSTAHADRTKMVSHAHCSMFADTVVIQCVHALLTHPKTMMQSFVIIAPTSLEFTIVAVLMFHASACSHCILNDMTAKRLPSMPDNTPNITIWQH